MKHHLEDIVKNDLCLGCGLCQSVTQEKIKLIIDDRGFYKPLFDKIDSQDEAKVLRVCPAINVENDNCKSASIWGEYKSAVNAWAKDSLVRHKASSGGVISALAIFLLESKQVDGVLQVGVSNDSYLYNRLYVSKSREDVLRCSSSRYAPAPLFKDIIALLDTTPDSTYAFVGKPCDIAGIKNLIKEYPQYRNRIKYYLSIFCAGMPSYNATEKAISTFGHQGVPSTLKYRGDGWPGYFAVTYSDGTIHKMTYNESWGKILGRSLTYRCKICPDGIGMLADISTGDSWNTKNGYPDFTEADGMNFCFIRTEAGFALFNEAVKNGYIDSETLNVSQVKTIQNYQYTRRQYVGWRIAVTQFATNSILNFQKLGYYKNALKSNVAKGIKHAYGTYLRLRKQQKQKS